MGYEHVGFNENVRGKVRVTITEAATLLGVHPNTVRGRVKAGVYEAAHFLSATDQLPGPNIEETCDAFADAVLEALRVEMAA
jgi:hypothetical protein